MLVVAPCGARLQRQLHGIHAIVVFLISALASWRAQLRRAARTSLLRLATESKSSIPGLDLYHTLISLVPAMWYAQAFLVPRREQPRELERRTP